MPNSSRRKHEGGNSMRLALMFCGAVSLLVLCALLFKLALLVSHSTFNGKNRFTIAIGANKTQVLSFEPQTQTISVLTLPAKRALSQKEVVFLLKIPVDGEIMFLKNAMTLSQHIDEKLWSLILSYNTLQTQLTILDLFRLWLFTKSMPSRAILEKTFSPPEIITSSDELFIDKLSSVLFTDSTLTQDGVSVQIVNGTEIIGLANRLARVIANMGGNVVSLQTADKTITASEVLYVGDQTYTLKRIAAFLSLPTRRIDKDVAREGYNTAISDIIVILGKDKAAGFVF